MVQSPSVYQYNIFIILNNIRYLVSLGGAHDRGLFVWDIGSGAKLTVNKLSK